MNLCKYLLALIMLFSLTACAGKYTDVMQEYDNSSITIINYSEIKYEKIKIPSVTSNKIDNKSPLYEFETGKSYFASFKLPEYEKEYEIEITSYLIGDHIDNSYIFFPTILVLDENFNTTRTINENVFENIKPSFFEVLSETGGIRTALKGKISFSNENHKDKYLIIYTKRSTLDSNMKKEATNLIPVPFAGAFLIIPVGKREVSIPYSPIGQIRVTTSWIN